MTITQLRYVVALAETGSFSLAAQKCSVTQPAITAQIIKLEKDLGVILFHRNKRQDIKISEIGLRFLEQAKKILFEAEKAHDIIHSPNGYVGGDFKLGIIPTVASTLIPLFLSSFIKKHPAVNLIIEEMSTADIIYKLKNRKINAGILSTPLDDELINENVLYREPFVAYVHENSLLYQRKEISPNQINTNELLLLRNGHCFSDTVRNFCKNKYEENIPPFELKTGSFETLIGLVDKQLGITLLPYLHTLSIPERNKSKLKQFERPDPSREISIVHLKEELNASIVKTMQNTILEVIRDVIPPRNVKVISPIE